MIKFRAWDKNQQIMRGVRGLFWTKNNLVAQCSPIGKKFDEFFTTILNDGEYHLMQSTGLFDKNGVEIFEGDLIHYTYEGFNWYVPVVYRECRFEVYHGTLSTIPASEIPSGKYVTNIGNSISVYRVEFTDMYVAGNIYENPDLLESVEE